MATLPNLMGATLLVIILTLALVWTAAWSDSQTFRIPNTLVLAGVVLGLLCQVWLAGLGGLGQGLMGMGLGLGLLFPMYLLGFMGAGDVKLMGAVGALLGPERLLTVLIFSIVAAGAVAAAYALAAWVTRGAPGPWRRYGRMLRVLLATGSASYVPPAPDEAMAGGVPVAVSIAIGTTAALLWPQ